MDAKLLRLARGMVEHYRFLLKPSDDPKYVGSVLELPGVIEGGDTPDEAIANLREAAVTLVTYMLEAGETPPREGSDAKRDKQVNLRLTGREKFVLEEAARRDGFRGLSDFVRAAALDKAG